MRWMMVVFLLGVLVACGVKGDLVLPLEAADFAQMTIVSVES